MMEATETIDRERGFACVARLEPCHAGVVPALERDAARASACPQARAWVW